MAGILHLHLGWQDDYAMPQAPHDVRDSRQVIQSIFRCNPQRNSQRYFSYKTGRFDSVDNASHPCASLHAVQIHSPFYLRISW